jgi:hypothetical protein
MGVDIVTFGCRLNTYESEVMRRETETAGLGELEGGAIVFNTCAVTGEAVRQARQAIRKARRENPQARIIVTGCAAQTEPASFGGMEEVDLVIGNDDKLKAQSYRALPEFGVNDFEKVRVNDIFEVDRDRLAHGRRHRGPGPRLCAGAERLRSPLHLLHHSLWPRQFAIRADGRRRRAGQAAGRQRLPRGRADRRRSHQLWPGLAGQADARQVWCVRS